MKDYTENRMRDDSDDSSNGLRVRQSEDFDIWNITLADVGKYIDVT